MPRNRKKKVNSNNHQFKFKNSASDSKSTISSNSGKLLNKFGLYGNLSQNFSGNLSIFDLYKSFNIGLVAEGFTINNFPVFNENISTLFRFGVGLYWITKAKAEQFYTSYFTNSYANTSYKLSMMNDVPYFIEDLKRLNAEQATKFIISVCNGTTINSEISNWDLIKELERVLDEFGSKEIVGRFWRETDGIPQNTLEQCIQSMMDNSGIPSISNTASWIIAGIPVGLVICCIAIFIGIYVHSKCKDKNTENIPLLNAGNKKA